MSQFLIGGDTVLGYVASTELFLKLQFGHQICKAPTPGLVLGLTLGIEWQVSLPALLQGATFRGVWTGCPPNRECASLLASQTASREAKGTQKQNSHRCSQGKKSFT